MISNQGKIPSSQIKGIRLLLLSSNKPEFLCPMVGGVAKEIQDISCNWRYRGSYLDP